VNIGQSAKQYIEAYIRRKIDRCLRNSYLDGDTESCYKQLDLLDKYWIPELDDAPFVLTHGDLSANNMIVDSQNNLERFVSHLPTMCKMLTLSRQYHRSWLCRHATLATRSLVSALFNS